MCDNLFCPQKSEFTQVKTGYKICSDCMLKLYGPSVKEGVIVKIEYND